MLPRPLIAQLAVFLSVIPDVCYMLHSRFMARLSRIRTALRFSTLALLALGGASYSCSQEAPAVTLPADEIRSLASHILRTAGKADCHPGDCTILVLNFKLPSGLTSPLGMQLADAVSSELAAQQTGIKLIERSRFRAYVEQERIPDALLNNDKAFQWLGKQLGATAVLNGATEVRGDALRIEVSLFSCEKEKAAPQDGFSLPSSDFASAMTPIDSFPQNPPSPEDASPPLVQRAGVNGISSPACAYCPNPDYTDPAREVKLNGDLVLEVTVSAEGNAIDARVVRGLPFGLNQSAMKTLRAWRFRPATREGQPIACRVMIEVTFRLN